MRVTDRERGMAAVALYAVCVGLSARRRALYQAKQTGVGGVAVSAPGPAPA